jgi:outer membrane protein assembly factor BamB
VSEINRKQGPILQPTNKQGPRNQHPRPIYRKSGASRLANRRLLILFALVMLPILAACTQNIGDQSTGWNPPVSVGGVVYVGTKDGDIVSLTEDASGNLRENWTFPGTTGQQDLIGVYKTPVVVGNLVYVNGINGFLYALDKESGNLTGDGWRRPDNPFDEPEPLVAGPAYDSSNDIILSPSEDGKLYAYTAKNGNEFWDPFVTGGPIWSTPRVERGVAYFGSHDHKVYAVTLDNGKERWSYETEGVVAGKPLVFDGKVIAGSFDKSLYALSMEDGELVWTVEGENWFWAGAVTDGRTIFAPNMDGNIYAIDRNGNLLWTYDVGSPIVSSPVLVTSGLVVAAKDGNLLLLDTSTDSLGLRRVLFNQKIGDTEIKAPLFAVGDSVYVGSLDKTVRRIDFKDGQRNVWCLDTSGEDGCVN